MDFIFDDDAEEVGAEIEAFCPKCKADTNHVVISKYEEEIRRVQCNACGDVHPYRKPRGDIEEETPEPVSAKKRATKVKPTWEQAMAKLKKEPKVYVIAQVYKENECIAHPKFGRGFVSEVLGPDKIEVTFQEGRRILIHNRQGMSLPPAAYAHAVDATAPAVGKAAKKGAAAAGAAAPAAKAAAGDGAGAGAAAKAAAGKGAKVEAKKAPSGKGEAAKEAAAGKGAQAKAVKAPEAKAAKPAAPKPQKGAEAKGAKAVPAKAKKGSEAKAPAAKPARVAEVKKPAKTAKVATRPAPSRSTSSKVAKKPSKPAARPAAKKAGAAAARSSKTPVKARKPAKR